MVRTLTSAMSSAAFVALLTLPWLFQSADSATADTQHPAPQHAVTSPGLVSGGGGGGIIARPHLLSGSGSGGNAPATSHPAR